MGVQHISAVTLAVSDMQRSIYFYQRLGFEVAYGGQQATFTSLRSGEAFVNLSAGAASATASWGRVIFRVDDVDAIHRMLVGSGLQPDQPRDASWGERYFHLGDPDGHELSFAELIPPSSCQNNEK